MKYVKLFEGFVFENNNDQNVMLIWRTMVDGYPTGKTAIIIDKDFNILDSIETVFDEKTGNYSKDAQDKMKMHKIVGRMRSLGDQPQDLYSVSTGDDERNPKKVTPEEAVEYYKNRIVTKNRLKQIASKLKND